jgi:hypothetical protein
MDARACATAAAQQSKEIPFEYKAEDQQDDHAANADMHAAKAEPAASAAVVAPIFNVSAGAAWCPTHVLPPPFVIWMQLWEPSALSN